MVFLQVLGLSSLKKKIQSDLPVDEQKRNFTDFYCNTYLLLLGLTLQLLGFFAGEEIQCARIPVQRNETMTD